MEFCLYWEYADWDSAYKDPAEILVILHTFKVTLVIRKRLKLGPQHVALKKYHIFVNEHKLDLFIFWTISKRKKGYGSFFCNMDQIYFRKIYAKSETGK